MWKLKKRAEPAPEPRILIVNAKLYPAGQTFTKTGMGDALPRLKAWKFSPPRLPLATRRRIQI